MSLDPIVWLCGGVTVVGLVLSVLTFRRRGAAAGLRGAAWSLIPVAAALTGVVPTLWQAGTAVVGFFAGLVFSPLVWAGVIVAGLSALLFLVSGVLRGRRRGAAGAGGTAKRAAPKSAVAAPDLGAAGAPTRPNTRPLPAKPSAPAADDDLSDIEEILKRRGIS